LPPAFEDEDSLLVRLDAERVEDERERELLRAALHEQHRPCEKELGAVVVELRDDAKRLRLVERLRLEERRAASLRVADDREILDPVDAEKHRCMRRVEDLVAALREAAKHTEEMPLRVRAQI